ncbi:MAG: TetR-like C-terminal domain-containing protein, partial [Eubacteriales bacterium]|nr:TetR-like C-terminal domain-containing protein [Eubacteriales bacterium]
NNHDFYHLLNERGLIYLIKDALINSMGLNPECEKSEAYIKAFAAYAIYGWIETWFQRGMKESADEIAEMFKMFGL